jgi:hypothetical protein
VKGRGGATAVKWRRGAGHGDGRRMRRGEGKRKVLGHSREKWNRARPTLAETAVWRFTQVVQLMPPPSSMRRRFGGLTGRSCDVPSRLRNAVRLSGEESVPRGCHLPEIPTLV